MFQKSVPFQLNLIWIAKFWEINNSAVMLLIFERYKMCREWKVYSSVCAGIGVSSSKGEE